MIAAQLKSTVPRHVPGFARAPRSGFDGAMYRLGMSMASWAHRRASQRVIAGRRPDRETQMLRRAEACRRRDAELAAEWARAMMRR